MKTELVTMTKEIYNRTLDLEIELDADAVRVNTEYLQRIILELVDNALKFSKKGQRVFVKGTSIGDEYIIQVHDAGCGFELTSLDDITAFKQNNRKKFEQQGLGIGLYLVKRLVEFNQGDLRIDTQPGDGTRVTVCLPLAQEKLQPSYEMELRA